MAAMAMRHVRQILRHSLTPLCSHAPEHSAVLCGSDALGLHSRVEQFPPSAPVLEFKRTCSSAYESSGSIFHKAREITYASDVHEYNRLLSNLNQKRRPNLIRDVYEDMLLDGVQPIRDTFYLLIVGCMKGSRLQDVMYFFEEMKAMGLTPDVGLYNCIITACGRSRQVDRAFQVAEEMEASGIQPRHRTFLALLRCCAIAGRVDEAYGVTRRMVACGLSLDKHFYSALIFAHKNKKPATEETVEKIFELLEQSKNTSSEDLRAAAATGESEMVEDAEDGLMNFLTDEVQPRRGFINRRLTVYHAAVAALSSLGNKEGVKTVLQLIEKDGHDLDPYCTIQLIKCYLAGRDFEQACAEYNKFLESGKQPNVDLYVTLIDGALCQSSPTTSAVAQKLLVELEQKGFFLNGQLGTQILQRACQQSTRDFEVANLVWDMMRKRGVRISKQMTVEYARVLERSDIPKDDPRLVAVKLLIDEDRKSSFRRGWTDYAQAGEAEQVLVDSPDELHGDGAVNQESPIEVDSSCDRAYVEQAERQQ